MYIKNTAQTTLNSCARTDIYDVMGASIKLIERKQSEAHVSAN